MRPTLMNNIMYYWDLLKGKNEHFDHQIQNNSRGFMAATKIMTTWDWRVEDMWQGIEDSYLEYDEYHEGRKIIFCGLNDDGVIIVTFNNRVLVANRKDMMYDVYASLSSYLGYRPVSQDPSHVLMNLPGNRMDTFIHHGVVQNDEFSAYNVTTIIGSLPCHVQAVICFIAPYLPFEEAVALLYGTCPAMVRDLVPFVMRAHKVPIAMSFNGVFVWKKIPSIQKINNDYSLIHLKDDAYILDRRDPIIHKKNDLKSCETSPILHSPPKLNAVLIPDHIKSIRSIDNADNIDDYAPEHLLYGRQLYIWDAVKGYGGMNF